MDIPYHTDVKIPGFHFTNTVNTSAKEAWSMVTKIVRALALETYYRSLSLNKRIHFVHEYLLDKIWYVTQIFTPPEKFVQHLNSAIARFIWRGDIFRFPLSTLKRDRMNGGWVLVDVSAKSRAFFSL